MAPATEAFLIASWFFFLMSLGMRRRRAGLLLLAVAVGVAISFALFELARLLVIWDASR